MNVLCLFILHGDPSLNFACSIVPQKSSIIQKNKTILCQPKNVFNKTTGLQFKENGYYTVEFL